MKIQREDFGNGRFSIYVRKGEAHSRGVKRGRRNLLWLLMGVVVLGQIILMAWPYRREPVFKGKRLGDWVRMVASPSGEGEEGKEAIRQIGTNGLPFLLRWIQYDPPKWECRISRTISRLVIFDDWVAEKKDRAAGAAFAFEVLREKALPAASGLVLLLGKTNDTIRFRTGVALGGIGPEAIPFFLYALTNGTCAQDRSPLVTAWSALGSNTARAVPALMAHLKEADPVVAENSCVLLGISRIEPDRVVPALSEAAGAGNAGVRAGAVWAIGHFGTNASSALPVLVRALGDEDTIVRRLATNSLRLVTAGQSE